MLCLLIINNQKEAETHLPELEARDGISIPMEDIGTSRVWNMRYRYYIFYYEFGFDCSMSLSKQQK
jgi:hypothetical protein